MSLHDRIMRLPKRTTGQLDTVRNAARMAKEADELMAEMAEALEKCRGVDHSEAIDADYAYTLYLQWKEQTNERN